MEDIPLLSDSYETDLKIKEFCDKNKEDKRCECIILSPSIYKFMKSSIVPYYCWYEPCKRDDRFLTSDIIEERKYCKLNLCEISLDDVTIVDGSLKVENDCSSSINPSIQLSQTIILSNIFDIPNLFISFLIPLSIFLLILLWYGM